jgi:tetratricopeptide (TPR) repeat protein
MNRVPSLLFAIYLAANQLSFALAQNTSEEAIYIDRAVLAYADKRFDDALKELTEALRLNGDSYEALYYEGLVYQELDRVADARVALERAHQLRPQSTDISFQLGVVFIKQGDLENAEPLFRQIYEIEPGRPNLGYYLGLIQYRKKNYRKALDFFNANVASDDEFAQLARYYSGLATAALGFPREARVEIDSALRLRPDSPLRASVPRFNELLEQATEAEKLFNAELRFGFLYDTNAAMALDPTLNITFVTNRQGVGQLIVEPQKHLKSTGEFASVDLSYSWLRTVNWEGTVAYRFQQVEYNQARSFSTRDHTPSIGLTRRGILSGPLGEMPYFAGLQWVYDNISLGNAPFVQRWTVNPYYSLVETPNNVTNLQFRVQAKDFFHDPKSVPSENRDALNLMGGLTHFFLFENGRHLIKLGYQNDTENAEGQNWSYRGNRLLVGLQYTLPWKDLRVRYDFDYHWRFYPHPNTLVPQGSPDTKKRVDREGLHLFSLSKDFTLGLQKFNVAMEYVFDNARSNLAPFRFKRYVVMPSVAWRF